LPCLSHPPWLFYSNYIWRRVEIMKLLITQFSPTSYHFIPLLFKCFHDHPVLNIIQLQASVFILVWNSLNMIWKTCQR
jgi:hypothetical protein